LLIEVIVMSGSANPDAEAHVPGRAVQYANISAIGSRMVFPNFNVRSLALRALLVVSNAAVGVAGGQMLSHTATSQQASVAEVRASVSQGSVFSLYYNNMWSEPRPPR
jgi:hypothetical protein